MVGHQLIQLVINRKWEIFIIIIFYAILTRVCCILNQLLMDSVHLPVLQINLSILAREEVPKLRLKTMLERIY